MAELQKLQVNTPGPRELYNGNLDEIDRRFGLVDNNSTVSAEVSAALSSSAANGGVINGMGELNSNKGWESFQWDDTNKFFKNVASGTAFTYHVANDYLIPVPKKAFKAKFSFKSNVANAGVMHTWLQPLDVDKNGIGIHNWMTRDGSETYLTQAFTDGDTVLHVEDASGWVDTGNWYQDCPRFGNYVDSNGKNHGEYGYSQWIEYAGGTGIASIDTNANTITYAEPINIGRNIEAGEPVCQAMGGDTYPRTDAIPVTDEWTDVEMFIDIEEGVRSDAGLAKATESYERPPSWHYFHFTFSAYTWASGAEIQIRYAYVEVQDDAASTAILNSKAGDNLVLNGNLELGDATGHPNFNYSNGLLTKNVTATTFCYSADKMTIDPTRDVYLNYRMAAPGTNHNAAYGIVCYDENDAQLGFMWFNKYFNADGSMTDFTKVIQPSELLAGTRSILYGIGLGQGGVALPLDVEVEYIQITQDIALETHPAFEKLPEQIAAAGDNLVLNGNAELGDATNWNGGTYDSGAVVFSVPSPETTAVNLNNDIVEIDESRDLLLIYSIEAAKDSHELDLVLTFINSAGTEFASRTVEVSLPTANSAVDGRYFFQYSGSSEPDFKKRIPSGATGVRVKRKFGIGVSSSNDTVKIHKIHLSQSIAQETHPAQIAHEADADAHGAAMLANFKKWNDYTRAVWSDADDTYFKSSMAAPESAGDASVSEWRTINWPDSRQLYCGQVGLLAEIDFGRITRTTANGIAVYPEFVLAPPGLSQADINNAIASLTASEQDAVTPASRGIHPGYGWNNRAHKIYTTAIGTGYCNMLVRFVHRLDADMSASTLSILNNDASCTIVVQSARLFKQLTLAEVIA